MKLPPFQRLVDEHWFAVARLAHALAGPVDGDDVGQQAWTQALAAYPKLRSADNLRGWLLTITARCAADLHRRRTRQVSIDPTGIDPAGIDPSADPSGANQLDTHPSGTYPIGTYPTGTYATGIEEPPDETLWAAVRALPRRQRTALALRYVVDLDHAQIARILETTPTASRRLVSDALTSLRRTLPATDVSTHSAREAR